MYALGYVKIGNLNYCLTFLIIIFTSPVTVLSLLSVIDTDSDQVVAALECQVAPRLPYKTAAVRTTGKVVSASPADACEPVVGPTDSDRWILLATRTGCDFYTKITNAQNAGYSAIIIYNEDSNSTHPMPMYGFGRSFLIPSCFTGNFNAVLLRDMYPYDQGYIVQLTDDDFEVNWWFILIMALIVAICLMVFVLCFRLALYFSVVCWARLSALREDFVRFARERRRSRRNRLFASALKQIAAQKWDPNQLSESCAICVEEFKLDDDLRILNCNHGFHVDCIDEWLINGRRDCPVCKRKVVLENHELFSNTDSETDDETAPLTNHSVAPSQYGNPASQRRENPFLRNPLNIQQASPDEERGIDGDV